MSTDRISAAEYQRLYGRGAIALAGQAQAPAKKSKYLNVPTTLGEMRFDSKGEATRWEVLKQQEADGVIHNLRRQVDFYLLTKRGELVEKYRADFTYETAGRFVVEDWKGIETADFKRKVRWMKSEFGHDVLVTRKA